MPGRKEISEATFRTAAEIRDLVAREGFPTDIISGGSTGTWDIDLELPEVTELQAGSYVVMDASAYLRIGTDFHPAMTIVTTVVSSNHEGFVTVDGGFKAFATDRGYGPESAQYPGVKCRFGGDEFAFLETKLDLGTRVEFIAPHCDPTVNLYDKIYVCRGDVVETTWPVMERS